MHKAHAVLVQVVEEYRKSALCVLKANASVNEQLLSSMTGGCNILIDDTWATKDKNYTVLSGINSSCLSAK